MRNPLKTNITRPSLGDTLPETENGRYTDIGESFSDFALLQSACFCKNEQRRALTDRLEKQWHAPFAK